MSDTINPETGEVSTGMPPAIAAAIIAVKKQIRQLGSDERNQHGGYSYVSVDKFYERLGPLMADADLALLIDETETEVRISDATDRDGKPRKTPWLFAQYSLAFMHGSGAISPPMRRSIAMPINGPQTYGAAQSYIEKQFLRQVFKVPTGEKDADETAQGEDAPARGRQTQGSGNGARNIPRRPEAAPAPSDAAAEATKRWREIKASIDATDDPETLLRLSEWGAFKALDKLGTEASANDPQAHRESMDMLRARADKRRRDLIGRGGLEAFNG